MSGKQCRDGISAGRWQFLVISACKCEGRPAKYSHYICIEMTCLTLQYGRWNPLQEYPAGGRVCCPFILFAWRHPSFHWLDIVEGKYDVGSNFYLLLVRSLLAFKPLRSHLTYSKVKIIFDKDKHFWQTLNCHRKNFLTTFSKL